MDQSTWLNELLNNLQHSGPEAVAALQYLRQHRTTVGVHEQPTAARWTITGRIQVHPRYLQGSPEDPYALGLIIHEVRHLQQGWAIALSVIGELEAWQLQFGFLRSSMGYYHADARRNATLEQLMLLPLNWDRAGLERARRLMQEYAGKTYRIDLLPLYPLPAEVLFRICRRQPSSAFIAGNRMQ